MRIRTRSGPGPAALALALASSGCAAATVPANHSLEQQAGSRDLYERLNEQAQRIAELEARIALLESEARGSREARDSTSIRTGDTIRIGGEPAPVGVNPGAVVMASEPSQSDDEARPVPSYRLYGKPSRPSRPAEPLAPLPTVTETLPVVPLPEQRARELGAQPRAGAGTSGQAAGPVADYRRALQLMKDRQFDDALAAFDALLAQNPSHPLAAKALYWRGEARYAKREYAQALREFEALLERFPQSDKAPDALLKTALCFRRLGAEDKAQASFRRLRADYPNSHAATLASREGST